MTSDIPYPLDEAYRAFSHFIQDTKERVAHAIANTEHEASLSWLGLILDTKQEHSEWKVAKDALLSFQDRLEMDNPTEHCHRACENLAKALGDIKHNNSAQKELQLVIHLLKGLYARAVWLDNGNSFANSRDPLEAGNRQRAAGKKREALFVSLWEVALRLEEQLHSLNESSESTGLSLNAAAIFSQLRNNQYDITTSTQNLQIIFENPVNMSLSQLAEEMKEEAGSHHHTRSAERSKAEEMAHSLTFHHIQLSGLINQLGKDPKSQARKIMLQELMQCFDLAQMTLALPQLSDNMVKVQIQMLSRVLKTYIIDLANLNILHRDAGPEITLLKSIYQEFKGLVQEGVNLKKAS